MKRKETMKTPINTNQPTNTMENAEKPSLSTQHDVALNPARKPSTASHPFRMTHGAGRGPDFLHRLLH
jgi:hypothetical protein